MVTFLVDIDVVCNDLWSPLLVEINDKFNTSYNVDHIVSWNTEDNFPTNVVSWLHKKVTGPGFFKNIPVRKNCYNLLKDMNSRYKVNLVTAHPNRFWKSTCYYDDKMEWVSNKFDFLKPTQVLFVSTKNDVCGDVLIDDAPFNITDFDRITIAFDQPYNRKTYSTFRASNWDNIYLISRCIGSLLDSGISVNEILSCAGKPSMLLKLVESKKSLIDVANLSIRQFLRCEKF